MLRRALLSLAGLALLAPGVPARAFPGDGCAAIGTHVAIAGSPVYGCQFIATGPVIFVAATSNPWVISVNNGSGPVVLAQRTESAAKNPSQAPVLGKLMTHANDHIFVSVSPWDYAHNEPCNGLGACGRDGVLIVQSQL